MTNIWKLASLALLIWAPLATCAEPLSEGDLKKLIEGNVSEEVIRNEVKRIGVKGPISIDTVLYLTEHLSDELQIFIIESAEEASIDPVDYRAQLCVAFNQKDLEWVSQLVSKIDFDKGDRLCHDMHFFQLIFGNNWYELGEHLVSQYPHLVASYTDSYGRSFLDYAYIQENDSWVSILESAGVPFKNESRELYDWSPELERRRAREEAQNQQRRISENQQLLIEAGKIISGSISTGSGDNFSDSPNHRRTITDASVNDKGGYSSVSCTMSFFQPSIGIDGHVEVRGSTNCPAGYDADIQFSYDFTPDITYADSPKTRNVNVSVFAGGGRNGPIQGTPSNFRWRSSFGGMKEGRVSSVTSRACECIRTSAPARGSN